MPATSVSHADVFFHAIRAGDLPAVLRMLIAEPDLAQAKSEQGLSPVLVAIYSGRNEIRDVLLSSGIVLELHEAAAAGQLVRVKQLVEKNEQRAKEYSPDGFPVIALAAVFGHFPVVRYLFENGANVNAAAMNGTGYNALTGAVASGHTEIATWLLASGADANYRYGAGYSPLLTAAANGHLEIVTALLEHGADPQAQTSDGKTALDMARERGHETIAAYLQSRVSRESHSE
jgi:adenosylhomocysteine nucleosidase